MVHQLSLCHASNMRAPDPVRLCFTGLGGEVAAGHAAVCGADKWPVRAPAQLLLRVLGFSRTHGCALQVVRDSRSYLEVFADRRASLVYLSADSPHELGALSPDDVYVVGGIVDRNRHKGLTQDGATAAGVRTARLPLAAHCALAGSSVLTVNQVLELLLAMLELKDWRAACDRVVPKRKREAEDGEQQLGRKARRKAAAEARAATGQEGEGDEEEDEEEDEDEEEADDGGEE